MRLRILRDSLRTELPTFLLIFRMIDLWLRRGVANHAFVKQVTFVASSCQKRSDISYGLIQAVSENLHVSYVWGLFVLE